jgi:hypothetical protein
MEEFIVKDGPGSVGSHQIRYRFPNGYGASVIRGGMAAYGGLELAVIKYENEGPEWSLCYDTPVTDDVLGYLDDDDVQRHLQEILDLPPHFTPARFVTS